MTSRRSSRAKSPAHSLALRSRPTSEGFIATCSSRVRAVLESDITERWRPAPALAPAVVRFDRWQP